VRSPAAWLVLSPDQARLAGWTVCWGYGVHQVVTWVRWGDTGSEGRKAKKCGDCFVLHVADDHVVGRRHALTQRGLRLNECLTAAERLAPGRHFNTFEEALAVLDAGAPSAGGNPFPPDSFSRQGRGVQLLHPLRHVAQPQLHVCRPGLCLLLQVRCS